MAKLKYNKGGYQSIAAATVKKRKEGRKNPLITESYDRDQSNLKYTGTKKSIFQDTTVKNLKKDKSVVGGLSPDYDTFQQAFQAARKKHAIKFKYKGKEYSTITRVEQKQGIKAGSKEHIAIMRSGKDYVDWGSKKKDSFTLTTQNIVKTKKKKRLGGFREDFILPPPTEI
jgi:hypothetical protein